MSSAWFEPAIPEVMRRQTYVFDRMATSVGGGMWRRKTKLLWEGLGPSAILSTTNPMLFYYRCRLIARYFSHPAHTFCIYSVLKVHQLVDCLPAFWSYWSLACDVTSASRSDHPFDTIPPRRWFAWAVQGDPRSVISAPPPPRCPGLLYDFKSKLSERFQEVRIPWPIRAWRLKRICAVCCILRSFQFHPCGALYVFRVIHGVNCACLCDQR